MAPLASRWCCRHAPWAGRMVAALAHDGSGICSTLGSQQRQLLDSHIQRNLPQQAKCTCSVRLGSASPYSWNATVAAHAHGPVLSSTFGGLTTENFQLQVKRAFSAQVDAGIGAPSSSHHTSEGVRSTAGSSSQQLKSGEVATNSSNTASTGAGAGAGTPGSRGSSGSGSQGTAKQLHADASSAQSGSSGMQASSSSNSSSSTATATSASVPHSGGAVGRHVAAIENCMTLVDLKLLIKRYVHTFDASDVAAATIATAMMRGKRTSRRDQEQLLQQMESMLLEHAEAGRCSPKQLATCLWALSKSSYKASRALLDAVVGDIMSSSGAKMGACSSRELTQLASGLSGLNYRSAPVWQQLASAAHSRLTEFDAAGQANLLCALATAHVTDTTGVQAVTNGAAGSGSGNTTAISIDASAPLLQAVADRVVAEPHAYSGRQLANIMWAAAQADHRRRQQQEQVGLGGGSSTSSGQQQQQQQQPQHGSVLARLRDAAVPALLQGGVGQCTATDLPRLAWALHASGCEHVPLWSAVQQHVMSVGGSLLPQQLCSLARVFAAIAAAAPRSTVADTSAPRATEAGAAPAPTAPAAEAVAAGAAGAAAPIPTAHAPSSLSDIAAAALGDICFITAARVNELDVREVSSLLFFLQQAGQAAAAKPLLDALHESAWFGNTNRWARHRGAELATIASAVAALGSYQAAACDHLGATAAKNMRSYTLKDVAAVLQAFDGARHWHAGMLLAAAARTQAEMAACLGSPSSNGQSKEAGSNPLLLALKAASEADAAPLSGVDGDEGAAEEGEGANDERGGGVGSPPQQLLSPEVLEQLDVTSRCMVHLACMGLHNSRLCETGVQLLEAHVPRLHGAPHALPLPHAAALVRVAWALAAAGVCPRQRLQNQLLDCLARYHAVAGSSISGATKSGPTADQPGLPLELLPLVHEAWTAFGAMAAGVDRGSAASASAAGAQASGGAPLAASSGKVSSGSSHAAPTADSPQGQGHPGSSCSGGSSQVDGARSPAEHSSCARYPARHQQLLAAASTAHAQLQRDEVRPDTYEAVTRRISDLKTINLAAKGQPRALAAVSLIPDCTSLLPPALSAATTAGGMICAQLAPAPGCVTSETTAVQALLHVTSGHAGRQDPLLLHLTPSNESAANRSELSLGRHASLLKALTLAGYKVAHVLEAEWLLLGQDVNKQRNYVKRKILDSVTVSNE